VVPDVIRPRLDEFLHSLGFTVQPFPYEAAPVPMFIALPPDERKSLHDTIDLGHSTSPGEQPEPVGPPDVTLWMPVSSTPGLRPLRDPHTLPVYAAASRADRPGATVWCTRCDHSHFDHEGYAYRPPLGFHRPADIAVVVCLVSGCACLTRLEPPTPV
jgi:hypothetical protein